MTNPLRLSLAAALTAALLAGCSTPSFMRPAPVATTKAEQQQNKIADLLDEATRAQPIRAAELRTEAARLLIQQNRRDEAIRILERIDTASLPPILRFDIAKLKAGTALEQQDSQQALAYLAEMPSSEPLPTAQAIELGELRARAYQQQHDTLGELRELIQVSQLQQDRQALHERIWALLNDIPTPGLAELVRDHRGSYYEQGWYELAYDLRTSTDLAQQYNALNDWQLLWQSHPAMLQPPAAVSALLSSSLAPAGRIGLLLPQSGPLARAAGAISDGFMAAYFEAQRDGMPVPELQLLDSTLINTPEQLIDVTRTMQLDMIIGPLDKDFVTAIARSPSLPVPVMALNNTDGLTPRHFYQLGLAAEDEAKAAALRAWQDGRRNMLMMIPETEWGTRVGQAFLRQFEYLGGHIVGAVSFAEQSDLAPKVAALLNTDSSAARAERVQQVIGNNVEFEKQPRGDADGLFLSAMPVDARQIKPLLDYNYAQDLPVYATSHIYSGSPNSISDIDLNNVQFCDLPWVLGPPSTLKLSLSQERDDTDTRFGRLYALGVDAYRLHPYLDQLEASPMARISGETGELYLEDGSRIGRELPWAQFRNGVPQLLSPTSY
ncbi:penicillin-binding protein activator [Marinobacterium nitratireducens]|uniref:Penicillin-binding protein activator n=1 Tax=Marinobacterium nitratireducens TaxID=518897 RepID=A0A917ZHE9_9GAMM|nr:penicillin-binding protein activator [Marinobacterium nitratireducens]GGO82552.1 penicillin-binding protein activator [Marinobacterium nitratireducens]